jgi:hypothetical protein
MLTGFLFSGSEYTSTPTLLAEHFQLVDRRGAVHVAGGEQHLAALFFQ